MIAEAFFSVLKCMALSFGLCFVGSVATFFLQDAEMARGLFEYWTVNFNGLLVGGTAWGMAWVVFQEGRGILKRLMNLIEFSEDQQPVILKEFEKTYGKTRLLSYGVSIGVLGIMTLVLSGYPLSGFAKYYLMICSCSLHVVGGVLIVHIYYTLRFFRLVDANYESIKARDGFVPMNFDSFNTYFIVTSSLGMFAVYFAFRGTLTAGFVYPEPVFQRLLIYPVLVYLPLGVLYSFYPRFILKRIYDRANVEWIDRLDRLRREVSDNDRMPAETRLNFELTFSQLRESIRRESKQFPVISLKDSPSLVLLVLLFLQYVANKDSAVSEFLKNFTR